MNHVIKFFEANRIARLALGLLALVGAVAVATASNLALGWAGLWVLLGLGAPVALAVFGRIAGAAGGESAWGAVAAGILAGIVLMLAWSYIPRPSGWGAWAGPGLAACAAINAFCLWLGQSQEEEADEETSWP